MTANAETKSPVTEAYLDFVAGFDVTLNEVTIQLLAVVIALVLALWQGGSLSRLWPFMVSGMIAGGFLGALGWLSPYMPGYLAALLLGSLAAISPPIGLTTMRVIMTLASLVMANAALSGYPWKLIPVFGYAGVTAALVFCVAIVYLPARVSLRWLPYPWVPIAWRAIAAWAVALAVLMIALGLAYPPDNMQNWFNGWKNS